MLSTTKKHSPSYKQSGSQEVSHRDSANECYRADASTAASPPHPYRSPPAQDSPLAWLRPRSTPAQMDNACNPTPMYRHLAQSTATHSDQPAPPLPAIAIRPFRFARPNQRKAATENAYCLLP